MSNIKVILVGESSLGKFGDVVSVKRGYARNYLIPNRMALTYTPEALVAFEDEKEQILKKHKEERARLEELHSQLDGYLLQSVFQAQDSGVLYGSISQGNIVGLLKMQNIEINKRQVELPNNEPIKAIGEHEVKVKVASDLVATIKFSVLSDKD